MAVLSDSVERKRARREKTCADLLREKGGKKKKSKSRSLTANADVENESWFEQSFELLNVLNEMRAVMRGFVGSNGSFAGRGGKGKVITWPLG